MIKQTIINAIVERPGHLYDDYGYFISMVSSLNSHAGNFHMYTNKNQSKAKRLTVFFFLRLKRKNKKIN